MSGIPAGIASGWALLDSGAALVEGAAGRRFFLATGEERRDFLHGQTTANVKALAAGHGCPAATLTAQGRPLALFALYEDGERLWVASTDRDAAATRAALSRFLVADDCDFEDDVDAACTAVAGPGAAAVLRAAGADDVPEPRSWAVRAAVLAGQPVMLFSRGDLRVPWIDVLAANAEGAPSDLAAVRAALVSAGAAPCAAEAVDVVRVESGTPLPGVDVDERRLAMEARLEWAIHFAKGCYVGQEVVERAVSRGRINHEIALLSLRGDAAPGSRVDGGGEHDVVTSVVTSPRLGRLALAYLPKGKAEPGTVVTLLPGGEAVVLEWPRPRVLPGRS